MSRPPTIDPGEIVGAADIAHRLHVDLQTFYTWQRRGADVRARAAAGRTTVAVPLPLPDGRVGNTPWWFWQATILPWARSTGRVR